jgi:hypothetical protein
MSSKLVERRLNDFKRRCGKDGDAALQLAYHAAMPVALNPELLHFLRINFFLDPPEQLPYTVEFEFLTSGLCREIDAELYEIEPEIRNELLRELVKRKDARQRIQDVATLLWQYVKDHSPWADRVELEQAQQLTALNFLDPAKAKECLDEAEVKDDVGSGKREWFIAMCKEIEHLTQISTPVLEDRGEQNLLMQEELKQHNNIDITDEYVSLQQKKNDINSSEKIQSNEVIHIFHKTTLITEPNNVPFPQADKFERVVDLLSLLAIKDYLTAEEIAENYQFEVRQAQYYAAAGRYLRLINKDSDVAGKVTFSLTDEGKYIVNNQYKAKFLSLVKKILQHEVFYKVFESTLQMRMIPSNEVIIEIMSTTNLTMSDSTMKRRASTVRGWIEWIWSKIDLGLLS